MFLLITIGGAKIILFGSYFSDVVNSCAFVRTFFQKHTRYNIPHLSQNANINIRILLIFVTKA